jgi:AAA15 family ATPase/GTPase
MYPTLFVGEKTQNFEVGITYSSNVSYIDTIFAYIPAGRTHPISPNAIEAVDIIEKTVITKNASKDFLKYILSLDYQLYAAKADGSTERASTIELWFEKFHKALCEIFDCDGLQLRRDARNLTFNIELPGREPFGLDEMSDGYTAFLDIYMELMMRMEQSEAVVQYSQPAIVLIDEIETHLHVELQKMVLPFLTRMFPNTQFIVATHSPFVINSVSNAVVYDLESNTRLDEDTTIYSYADIIDGFYDIASYSTQAKNYFERYKLLCEKECNEDEIAELKQLRQNLNRIPGSSKELYLAFKDYERRRAVNGQN